MTQREILDEIQKSSQQIEQIGDLINTFLALAKTKSDTIKHFKYYLHFPKLAKEYEVELSKYKRAVDRLINYQNKKIKILLTLSQKLKTLK
tara:strand:- start:2836 stop:3108 length:273 start_codon:yes stop_codon:yes gene_type:complete